MAFQLGLHEARTETGSGDEASRVGFRIVDLATGRDAVMAHVDHEEGPSVGKYTVDVDAVEQVTEQALTQARGEADVVLVDEIAPMEVASELVVRGVPAQPSSNGFIGEVEDRDGLAILEVTFEKREANPRTARFVGSPSCWRRPN